MADLNDITIETYTESDNDEALDLERKCIQGSSYQMWFKRAAFHRRAENLPDWEILTARLSGKLVGLVSTAIKEVTLNGKNHKAAFFFDLRVHPDVRGFGVGKLLSQEAIKRVTPHVSFAYTYCIADTSIADYMTKVSGAQRYGGYAYLVYPVYRHKRTTLPLQKVDFEEVHRYMLSVSPPFDFYAYPDCRPDKGGYEASWMIRSGNEVAGCSAWNNREILAEVIESVPGSIQLAEKVSKTWPFRLLPWPAFPEAGNELRSWYLFDFFVTTPRLARELMRHIARQAIQHGIDYCYIPHYPHENWVKAIRADVPRLFSPRINYHLMIKSLDTEIPELNRIYVDIRDI